MIRINSDNMYVVNGHPFHTVKWLSFAVRQPSLYILYIMKQENRSLPYLQRGKRLYNIYTLKNCMNFESCYKDIHILP